MKYILLLCMIILLSNLIYPFIEITIASSNLDSIEEILFVPSKNGLVFVGLKIGEIYYHFTPSFGPMLSTKTAYVPIEYRSCLYFNRVIDEYLLRNTSFIDWKVYSINYITTPALDDKCLRIVPWLREIMLEKTLIVAYKDNIAILILMYRNIANRDIILEQYPTHIHRGTDGISMVTVYPHSARDLIMNGYYVDNPNIQIPPQLISDIRTLHKNTHLYINGVYKGVIGDFSRWSTLHSQSPGFVHLKHTGSYRGRTFEVNLYALNDVIQIITNDLYIRDIYVNNAILDIQHRTILLKPYENITYYYIISSSRELSQSEIQEIHVNVNLVLVYLPFVMQHVETYPNTVSDVILLEVTTTSEEKETDMSLPIGLIIAVAFIAIVLIVSYVYKVS